MTTFEISFGQPHRQKVVSFIVRALTASEAIAQAQIQAKREGIVATTMRVRVIRVPPDKKLSQAICGN